MLGPSPAKYSQAGRSTWFRPIAAVRETCAAEASSPVACLVPDLAQCAVVECVWSGEEYALRSALPEPSPHALKIGPSVVASVSVLRLSGLGLAPHTLEAGLHVGVSVLRPAAPVRAPLEVGLPGMAAFVLRVLGAAGAGRAGTPRVAARAAGARAVAAVGFLVPGMFAPRSPYAGRRPGRHPAELSVQSAPRPAQSDGLRRA